MISSIASSFLTGAINAYINPSEDPRWDQAEREREAGREALLEGQDHIDNVGEAITNVRPFEAAHEAVEAVKVAFDADAHFREANRLESEAAQDAAANGSARNCIIA